MEMEILSRLIAAVFVAAAVVSVFFFISQRADETADYRENYMEYAKIFARHSEVCEKYKGELVGKNEFREIISAIAYSGCRTLSFTLDFSIDRNSFEEMVKDIFPEGKAPPVIYKSECAPFDIKSGSFVVVSDSEKYLYGRGDNIIIFVSGGTKKDVIICGAK